MRTCIHETETSRFAQLSGGSGHTYQLLFNVYGVQKAPVLVIYSLIRNCASLIVCTILGEACTGTMKAAECFRSVITKVYGRVKGAGRPLPARRIRSPKCAWPPVASDTKPLHLVCVVHMLRTCYINYLALKNVNARRTVYAVWT